MQDGCHCQTVVTVLDDIALLLLERVPNALRLHIDLHQHRPLLIVGAGQGGELDGGANLFGGPPDDDFGGAATMARVGESEGWWWRGGVVDLLPNVSQILSGQEQVALKNKNGKR